MPAFFQQPRRMFQAGAPLMQPQQPKPVGQHDPLNQGLRHTPRGMFGRIGSALTNGGKRSWSEVLATLGAGLQQMDGGSELTDYLAQREQEMLRREIWGEQTRRGKIEDDRAQQEQDLAVSEAQREREQQAEMEAMIAQLPPDQQMLARMNPQAFVGGMMRHRYPAPRVGGIGEDETDADGWSYSN